MAFLTYCNNKGCGKNQEPFIDPNDNKVYCSECERELENITVFAKNQMKMNKQFRKKLKKPYSTKCQNCNREDQPVILNNELVCPHCKLILTNLSEPFKIMLKEKLRSPDR